MDFSRIAVCWLQGLPLQIGTFALQDAVTSADSLRETECPKDGLYLKAKADIHVRCTTADDPNHVPVKVGSQVRGVA